MRLKNIKGDTFQAIAHTQDEKQFERLNMEKGNHMEIMKKISMLKNIEESEPILSVILGFPLGNSDTKTPSAKIFLSQFHSLQRTLREKEKKDFCFEIEKIDTYLREEFNTRGKRAAAFYARKGEIWEVFDFEFILPNYIGISKKPYLQPLLNGINTHNRFFVALIDRAKARFFSVHLGEIEERFDIIDPWVPQKVRANEQDFYGRSDKILRHIQDHLNRHLHLIARTMENFVRKNYVSFIIIGGHKNLFSKIRESLPSDISKKVIGSFVTELNIPINDVFLKSKKIAETLHGFKIINNEVKI